MKTTTICSVTVMVATLVLLQVITAFAEESSFLTERIIQSVEHIKHNNEQNKINEAKDKAYLTDLIQQKHRAEAAQDAKDVHNIQNRFYLKRTEMLNSWAQLLVDNEKAIKDIYSNLEKMNKQRNRAEYAGMSRDIDRTNVATRKAIEATLNNYRLIIQGAGALMQGQDYSAIANSVTGLAHHAHQFYHASDDNNGLQDGMKMVMDALTTTDMLKMKLRELHDGLLSDVYNCDIEYTVGSLNTLVTKVLGDGINPGQLDMYRNMDSDMRHNGAVQSHNHHAVTPDLSQPFVL